MRIKIRVMPRAKKERIEKLPDGLKVYADYLNVKKNKVMIVLGETSRDKVVEIEGI